MKSIRLYFVALGLWAMLLGLVGYCQPAPTNGLTAYYPLNGNANDASGNGLNGTAINGLTFVTDLPGLVANFNGLSQYISLPAAISNYEDLSVTFWLKTGQSNPNGFPYCAFLVSRDIPNANYDWNICLGLGREILFHTGTTTNDSFVLTTSDIPSNQWIHVACVADSVNGTKTIYLNSIVAASTGWVPNPYANNGVAPFLGNATAGIHPLLNGRMADVRFYNRALSATDVGLIYSSESAPWCFRPATATASVVNGFLVGTTITDYGCGYTNTPLVMFLGGGGIGAGAVAVVSNGLVAQLNITSNGSGYTNAPAVVIGLAPAIAVPPQPVTVNLHSNASFSMAAAGPTALTYQWLFSGTNIAGATASVLTISNVLPAQLGNYSVLVTNVFGSITSAPALLSMYPYLVTPFGGVVADWGQNALLTVQAGGSGPFTYQWYQNGTAVAGATNAVLDFSSIQFTNGGLYSVVVTSPYGSVSNAPAQVVVNPAGAALGLYPGVTITGTTGYSYIIQRTANLSDTNAWTNVSNITLTQPVQLWVDTNIDAALPANPFHFYRVLPGQ